jgi:hypothetical protein
MITNSLDIYTVESFPINETRLVIASGSHLQVIGDTMGHDKSTISRVIRQVADALVEMKDTFIKWPQTPEKLNSIKNGDPLAKNRKAIITFSSTVSDVLRLVSLSSLSLNKSERYIMLSLPNLYLCRNCSSE